MHITAKFHHPTFNRSEVIVLINKQMLLKTSTTSLHYAMPVGSEMTNHAQQWLWGNAGERRSWALKISGERSQAPHSR